MDIDIIQQHLATSMLDRVKKQEPEQQAADPGKQQQLKEACAGFEAIFLNTMIKNMRKTLPGDALFEDSHGMNLYKSMQDQYLAEELSKSKSGVGIKEYLYDELKDSL